MKKEKTLTLIDMIGMTLSAFVSMELISTMAIEGPSVIISLILIGGSYLFTHCVICAELGSTYPDQGGIYSWVKRGLGDKWAARTNWWYWLNVVGFVPSVMIPTVAIFQQLFWPDMPLFGTIGLSIAGTWLIVLLNVMPLKNTKIVNNVGTAAKIIFCLALIAGGIYFAVNGRSQVAYTMETAIPKFSLSLVALIPVFVYGLTGMDSVGCAAEEMKDPRKDMPKALVISALISMALYILATIAVQVILPIEAVDGTTGLIDAVMVVYGTSRVVVILVAIALALLFFSNAFAWPLAANRVAQEAAEEGEFPKIFAKTNRFGSPVGSAVIMGIASTALILFYAIVATSNENLFWTILAFTGIIYLTPYIVMTLAFLRARKNDPDRERPFKVPGGKVFATICAVYHIVVLAISCVSFLIPPEGEGVGYVVILIVSVVATQIVGEIILHRSMKNKND